MRILLILALCAAGGLLFWATGARGIAPATFSGLQGDPVAGARIFWAAGCASCHAAPDAEGEDRLVLSGGARFPSDFGTFIAPNISSDPDHGIGDWTVAEFASALTRGVSPDGRHYYPAFPYTSYTRMRPQDLVDLKVFMDTLPRSAVPSLPNEVSFPFNIRRGLGLWKALYLSDEWVMTEAEDETLAKGRYLVEALGHCGECHTPRSALGGLDTALWLSGAPNPSGDGRVPNITPAELDWSAGDIAYYLDSGFTPDFDSVGGHMASVVSNLARLEDSDRSAIAAYLKATRPIGGPE